jgi:spore maturation protein CgeB
MLLLQHHPSAAKGLQEHLRRQREENRQSRYQILQAKNGQPYLLKNQKDQSQPLHSPDNPMQEMVAQMQPHMAQQPGMIFLFSVGLGYALQALKNWLASHRLVVIEPDYDILFEFLRMTHWNAFLPNPNIHFFTGENAIGDAIQLLQLHSSLQQKKIACFSGRTLSPGEEKQFDQIQKCTIENPNVKTYTEPYAFLFGDAHERLRQPFVEEAKHAELSLRGIHRPAYINTFLANETNWRETLGEPLPKQLASFTKNVLRQNEWKQVSDAEIGCSLWCYDDPFRGAVDDHFFTGLAKIYCYDPFITKKLRDQSQVPVEYLPAATAFDANTPNRCESLKGKTWDITFVGSTGLQRHEDVLTQLINTNHPVYQKIESLVATNLQKGLPVSYDDLLKIDIMPLKFSTQQKTVYLQDLATFLIRRIYLSVLKDLPLHIFGDRGWNEEHWVGEVKNQYAGHSLSYDVESPYVYANSKINLNLFNVQCVNSPTIRMFDVMACGGFLLTEYRPFMDEFFSTGEHIAVFRNPDELVEKVNYYLSHEENRNQTAKAGQEFVLNHHRYRHRLPVIFSSQ